MKTYKASTVRSWIKILACICAANTLLLQGVDAAACVSQVSPGDQGVGISAIDDASCRNGGIGCFADVCRYCKTRDTTQAANFQPCPTYVAKTTAAPTPAVGGTTSVTTTTCASCVAAGNVAQGFSAYSDAGCQAGTAGGCFQSSTAGACRYCKTVDNDKTRTFLPCANYVAPVSAPPSVAPAPVTTAPAVITAAPLNVDTDVCPATVSVGDQNVGISALTDKSCKTSPGVGCKTNSDCRFCKTKESIQASQFVWCSSISSTTPTPTTKAPTPSVTGGTASVTTSAPTTTCASCVSVTNVAQGFSAYSDAGCQTGTAGGCFQSSTAGACRYCKTVDNDKTKSFLPCASYVAPTSAPVTTAPPATAAPLNVDTDVCPATVSVGDQNVGISALTDKSCKTSPGVGCKTNSDCRFCKTKESIQASQFVWCTSIKASTPSPTPAPTTPTPSRPGFTSTTTCASVVSAKNIGLGFSAYSDSTCLGSTAGGCFAGSCRYCGAQATASTKGFLPCSGSTASTTATTAPAITCASLVSAKNVGLGFSAFSDATCTANGGACFVQVQAGGCRYCQAQLTDSTKSFTPCPTPAPVTPAPAPTTATCASVVSASNQATGFSAFSDATCKGSTATNCFTTVQTGCCRYCKTKETATTASFIACPVTPTSTPKPTTPTPGTNPITTPAPATGPVITQGCMKVVSAGDAQVGIAMVTDNTCVTGLGKDMTGCDVGSCRFCKTRDTDNSRHMHPCSEFSVIPTSVQLPASNYCSPKITSTQALGGIWANVECVEWYKGSCYKANCPLCKFYDTSASTGLPVCVTPPGPPPTPTSAPGAPAPNLCTEAVLSETQPSVGISAMWDNTCTSTDKECVAACRFCQFYPTASSASYKLCSSIQPLPPPPMYVAPAPGVVKPSPPDVNECSKKKWTAVNEAAGIWTNAQCYEKDALGMCVAVVCSPCQFYTTELSYKYPLCVNGVFPFWPDTVKPAMMMASVRDSAPVGTTSASASLSSSTRIMIAMVAAVGAVAVFAVMAFGAKRMLERVVAAPAGSVLANHYDDEAGVVQQPQQARAGLPTHRQRKGGSAPRSPVSA